MVDMSANYVQTATSSPQLHTARLFMRPVTGSDLAEYTKLLTDPAVMQFVGINAGDVPSAAEIEALHENSIEVWKTRGWGKWSIFDIETWEFVGFCGFRSEDGQPELIEAIHRKFWGRRLALEAAQACLHFGFVCLGFRSVKAYTRPGNWRARRLLEKLGGVPENIFVFHGVEAMAYLLPLDADGF